MLDCTNSLRDYQIIRPLLKTGIRVSELITLELCCVDFEQKMMTIFGKGKNGEEHQLIENH